MSFGPGLRLRARGQFTAVKERGRRVATRHLTILASPNGLEHDRLGIIVSRKFGGAVARNRAKRRLREIFRHRIGNIGKDTSHPSRSFDLVAIPRREMTAAAYSAIEAEFVGALDRLRGRKPS